MEAWHACAMSDTRTDLGKNFRTAYYETLGFKEEASDLNLLEDLLKADVIGKMNVVWFNNFHHDHV